MILDFLIMPIIRWRHRRFSKAFEQWPQWKRDRWTSGVLDEIHGGDWSDDVRHMIRSVVDVGIGYRDPHTVRNHATEEVISLLSRRSGQAIEVSKSDRLGLADAIKNGADGNDFELQRILCCIAPVARGLVGNDYPKIICQLLDQGMLIRPANATKLLQAFGVDVDAEKIYAERLEADLEANTAVAKAPSRKHGRL